MGSAKLNSGYIGADQRREKSGVISHKKLWAENLSNSFLYDSKGSFNKDSVGGLKIWLNERSISNNLTEGSNIYDFRNLVDFTQDPDWRAFNNFPFNGTDTLTVKKENNKRLFNFNVGTTTSNNRNGSPYFPCVCSNGNNHTFFIIFKKKSDTLQNNRMSICNENRLSVWGDNSFGTAQEGAGWTLNRIIVPFDMKDDYHIYTFRRTGNAAVTQENQYQEFWVDGGKNFTKAEVSLTKQGFYPSSIAEFDLGRYSSWYMSNPTMIMKELLIFNHAITDDQVAFVHNYLSKKHNITLDV